MRRKHLLKIPSSRICLGDTPVRTYGASLLNKTSNIIAKYHFIKSNRKQLKDAYISKYTVDQNTYSLNYSGTSEMYACPIPNPPRCTLLAAAIHIYGCQLDELRLPWLPPAMCHLVSSMCIYDYVIFCNLWLYIFGIFYNAYPEETGDAVMKFHFSLQLKATHRMHVSWSYKHKIEPKYV